ncbi:MAG: hypothetical protein WCI73_03065 [Phycisphaerae bacterium]
MSHKKLAEIVVRSIEYFELADNEQLAPYTALQHLEGISVDLAEATPEEQAAVRQAAKERLAWFLQEPDKYGYTPRQLLTAEHRRLLEGIASGAAFGQPGDAALPPDETQPQKHA